MNRQEMADRLLLELEAAYDKEQSLIVRDYQHWVGGYHKIGRASCRERVCTDV